VVVEVDITTDVVALLEVVLELVFTAVVVVVDLTLEVVDAPPTVVVVDFGGGGGGGMVVGTEDAADVVT